jgi:two-component system, LuxR family, response regulator FixJ
MIDARQTGCGPAEIGSPAKKPLIYVVDDDHDVLSSLRFLLEAEDFDVRTFRSGSALLWSSARDGADCLVVDYKMAGIDGLELASRLRGMGVCTPIVLITGYPDENIEAKASLAGVPRVLLKPNLEDSLAECVRRAINPDPAAAQR